MYKNRKPTLSEIDQLIEFLPILYAEGFTPIKKWHGGVKDKDGMMHVPYPEYHEDVIEFFRLVSTDSWLDYQYDPQDAERVLENEKSVAPASLDEIKTLLTYCVRGEHFSDGHWGEMIELGFIRRILERLIELRKQLDENLAP